MTEKPEASVLTARRAAQHFRLSSADDACEHLYILIVRSSLGPSPPNAGRYTVASRFRRRSCERGYIFPRAPEQFVTSPLCLVGYVRWDARSDRVPPVQTIIFSSLPGRTKGCRPPVQKLLDPLCADGEIWAARRMSRAVNVLVWAQGAWIVPTLHCDRQRLTARMQTEAQARVKANAQ